MKYLFAFALTLCAVLTANVPHAVDASVPSPPSPVGTWKWFVGRDITFHEDHTVTYPGNFATWQWLDEPKRELRIDWKTIPSVDLLTLSDDGKHLTSLKTFPGIPADHIEGTRVVSPLGIWRMNRGANITYREDHTAAFAGVNSGFWYWLDEDQRRFKVEWTTIPFVGTFTLAEDGQSMEGSDYLGGGIRGNLLTGPAPVSSVGADSANVQPAPAATPGAKPAEAAKAAAGVTPVGKWRWFYGPDLTFQEDGAVTGTNRTAHWTWTDQAKREFRVDFGGQWAAYHDSLILSENGNHIEGTNNADMHITGDRITAENAAVPATAASLLGAWAWSTGHYLTFHADGTMVTTGGHSGHWAWSDEAKQELKLTWEDGHTDQLTLSGRRLSGTNSDGAAVSGFRVPREPGEAAPPTVGSTTAATTPSPAPATPPVTEGIINPVGQWRWFLGPNLTFGTDGTVTGTERPARWSWTDQTKRELKIEWGSDDPDTDMLTLSEDGNSLRGYNANSIRISGRRIAPAAADQKPVAAASSLPGTWSWFVGPDLTFHTDGTLTGTNRVARWKWTDEKARQLQIVWDGVQSGLVDQLTLSDDGKHLEGVNNDSIPVTGDHLDTPAEGSGGGAK